MNKDPIELEQLLLTLEVRKDRNKLEELLDDNFLEVIPSGERWTREQIIDALVTDSSPAYEAFDFQAKELSEDMVIVSYITKSPASGKEAIRSSLWKKTNNTWRMVFHQGTIITK